MRILWFSLSPCGSIRRSGEKRVIQGWMISLEDEIKKYDNIELHVAYFSSTEAKSFEFEGTVYHPIYNRIKNPFKRTLERRKPISKTDKLLLPKMLEVVETVKPDLIHIHGTEERFGLIQDYIKNVPIVFSIQGLIAPYTIKFFSGMPDKDIYRFESLYDKLRFLSYRNDYRSFAERAKRECGYLSKAKYIFGRTFWDEYITGLLNVHRNYMVVDEILRFPFYEKQWNKQSFSGPKFKIVSTISSGIYKGYETVLRTANLLKQYSNIDFEWTIAGYDRHDKWVKIAERYTKITSDDVNIKLRGRLGAEELADLLVDSDVYVHVSHIENSPNSVCEAMLVGMPVIASFAGGTASLLTTDKDGLLVQEGDPYIYGGAIVHMYEHFDYAKQLAQSARRRALERHNQKRIGQQLIDAYHKIQNDFNNQ